MSPACNILSLAALALVATQASANSKQTFGAACQDAFAAALSKPAPNFAAMCGCMYDTSRQRGVPEGDLLAYAQQLRSNPLAPAPERIKGAASHCFNTAVAKVNQTAAADSAARAAAHNARPEVRIRYEWKAWLQEGGAMAALDLPVDATHPIRFASGMSCAVTSTHYRQRSDGALLMREALRNVTCRNAAVTAEGTLLPEGPAGCSHTLDGKIGIGGYTIFQVRDDKGAPVGTLVVSCSYRPS